jgi:hypothetical protein
LATLLAIFKLLPGILSAIQALEAAIPLPAAGKAKLDLILGTVSDVYNADQTIQKQLPGEALAGVVTSIVSRIVGTFNALGIFSKKPA